MLHAGIFPSRVHLQKNQVVGFFSVSFSSESIVWGVKIQLQHKHFKKKFVLILWTSVAAIGSSSQIYQGSHCRILTL